MTNDTALRRPAMKSVQFTLYQARKTVPEIERLLVMITDHKEQIMQTHALIDSMRRSVGADGTIVDSDTSKLEHRTRELTSNLKRLTIELRDTGVHIKDIDRGLIDWLAVHDGHEVYLCWKRGEPTIEWWHEINDGYAGRRPVVPEEWLE